MSEQYQISVEQLLEWAHRFDVPEGQREMVANAQWCAKLVDSLVRPIPFGAPLLWEPRDECERPRARYRDSSKADWWIVDGQQRISGILAAFGKCPPWIPEDRWVELGGPSYAVDVWFSQDGRFAYYPHNPGKARRISLSTLCEAASSGTIRVRLHELGVLDPEPVAERLAALAQKIMDTRIPLTWLHGGVQDAVDAFVRHNRGGSGHHLTEEECRLAVLTMRCGGLQREIIDPAVRELAAEGFGASLGRRRIVTVMQWLLPSAYRKLADALDPVVIEAAACSAVEASLKVPEYLRRYGIMSDELLSPPGAATVIAGLFARFPEAAEGDFAARWLAHLAAQGRYEAASGLSRPAHADARTVHTASTLEEATAGLAAELDPYTEGIHVDQLTSVVQSQSWGPAGMLYAMAVTAGEAGSAADLHDPRLTAPDRRLRLHPLNPGERTKIRSLASYALMSDESVDVLRERGGWGRAAYEELGCPDSALDAQLLPHPITGLGDGWQDTRTKAIVALINDYLDGLGPVRDPDPSETPGRAEVES
ncbi:DUF262 domain-containing protein [Streptomyces sp. NBC_00257]|uniref:DUF262 domain-containing protein n=1 Tax=unclassified Streptomyces TaxID=2593676 RepID=UPI002252CB61|nr:MULTISPECIES: DUF262 domain-containing protein [unclassified Streptomyces]MCX5431564.1 DUF262 domain-containing protein [Streptomyces sp. NBC_00062]